MDDSNRFLSKFKLGKQTKLVVKIYKLCYDDMHIENA